MTRFSSVMLTTVLCLLPAAPAFAGASIVDGGLSLATSIGLLAGGVAAVVGVGLWWRRRK